MDTWLHARGVRVRSSAGAAALRVWDASTCMYTADIWHAYLINFVVCDRIVQLDTHTRYTAAVRGPDTD